MATDLSLLMPKPETLENSSITARAGEIADTESAKRAKSSAKAKGTTEPRPANLSRGVVGNDEEEGGKGNLA